VSAHIRLATADDAAAVAAIYAPEVRETAITFEIDPPGADEMRRRIVETTAQYPWLVFERDGEVRGYAYATTHRSRAAYRWAVDVSIYLHRGARGQGVGRALYTALLDILPQQGFTTAHAGITLPNAASVALHESMGFAGVGVYRGVGYKLEAWHDVGWWSRNLLPHPASPAEPLPLPAVSGSAPFHRALDRATLP
jgi:phosphinothricin acetyltransferase